MVMVQMCMKLMKTGTLKFNRWNIAETKSQSANASTILAARPARHFNPCFDLQNPVMPGTE